MDKAFWKAIADDDYNVPRGYDVQVLTDELLENLANVDTEWRDVIAYRTLFHWINKKQVYTSSMLRDMLDRLMDNAFVGVSQVGDVAVLRRSFSILVISLIVYHDTTDSFLEQDEFDTLLDAALRYLGAEQDMRGYDPDLGWVHAIAHVADLLKFMIRSKKSVDENHEYILQSITNKLMQPTDVIFVYDEDERLALTALEIVRRGEVDFEAIVAILHQLEHWKNHNDSQAFDAQVFAAHQNVKHFLRSWYFQVTKIETDDLPEDYQHGLVGVLERTVRAYNF